MTTDGHYVVSDCDGEKIRHHELINRNLCLEALIMLIMRMVAVVLFLCLSSMAGVDVTVDVTVSVVCGDVIK